MDKITGYNVFQVSHPRKHGEVGKFIAMFFDEDSAIEYAAEYIESDHHKFVIQTIDLISYPLMRIGRSGLEPDIIRRPEGL